MTFTDPYRTIIVEPAIVPAVPERERPPVPEQPEPDHSPEPDRPKELAKAEAGR